MNHLNDMISRLADECEWPNLYGALLIGSCVSMALLITLKSILA